MGLPAIRFSGRQYSELIGNFQVFRDSEALIGGLAFHALFEGKQRMGYPLIFLARSEKRYSFSLFST